MIDRAEAEHTAQAYVREWYGLEMEVEATEFLGTQWHVSLSLAAHGLSCVVDVSSHHSDIVWDCRWHSEEPPRVADVEEMRAHVRALADEAEPELLAAMLAVAQDGSWAWAKAQMLAGRKVRRASSEFGVWYCDWPTEPMELSIEDIDATDWVLDGEAE
jgi:hypothetical protein